MTSAVCMDTRITVHTTPFCTVNPAPSLSCVQIRAPNSGHAKANPPHVSVAALPYSLNPSSVEARVDLKAAASFFDRVYAHSSGCPLKIQSLNPGKEGDEHLRELGFTHLEGSSCYLTHHHASRDTASKGIVETCSALTEQTAKYLIDVVSQAHANKTKVCSVELAYFRQVGYVRQAGGDSVFNPITHSSDAHFLRGVLYRPFAHLLSSTQLVASMEDMQYFPLDGHDPLAPAFAAFNNRTAAVPLTPYWRQQDFMAHTGFAPGQHTCQNACRGGIVVNGCFRVTLVPGFHKIFDSLQVDGVTLGQYLRLASDSDFITPSKEFRFSDLVSKLRGTEYSELFSDAIETYQRSFVVNRGDVLIVDPRIPMSMVPIATDQRAGQASNIALFLPVTYGATDSLGPSFRHELMSERLKHTLLYGLRNNTCDFRFCLRGIPVNSTPDQYPVVPDAYPYLSLSYTHVRQYLQDDVANVRIGRVGNYEEELKRHSLLSVAVLVHPGAIRHPVYLVPRTTLDPRTDVQYKSGAARLNSHALKSAASPSVWDVDQGSDEHLDPEQSTDSENSPEGLGLALPTCSDANDEIVIPQGCLTRPYGTLFAQPVRQHHHILIVADTETFDDYSGDMLLEEELPLLDQLFGPVTDVAPGALVDKHLSRKRSRDEDTAFFSGNHTLSAEWDTATEEAPAAKKSRTEVTASTDYAPFEEHETSQPPHASANCDYCYRVQDEKVFVDPLTAPALRPDFFCTRYAVACSDCVRQRGLERIVVNTH